MAALTPAQRARVEQAVAAAEARTSAEFVCAVTRAADTYFTVPLLVAAVLSLALPLLGPVFGPSWTDASIHDPGLTVLQLLAFGILGFTLTRPPIAVAITPGAVKTRRVARLARATFLECGLAGVERRNGVLLFVSLAEHRVEVIADSGVHARVDAGAWQEVVDAFTAAIRGGDVADGFIVALDRLAAILERPYPRAASDRNEIADRLVEID